MKRILIVFGTRPEAIKMAPVVRSLKQCPEFEVKVCVTAQHREMLDQVLNFFRIRPDYDLDLMKGNQTLFSLTASILTNIKPVFEDFQPDYVFVHGDTTTSMTVSLAAYYFRTKVCHVEAGLRTHNKYAPYPEEINRAITARISDYHFAPTEKSKSNLVHENIVPESILVTGNTVIDALFMGLQEIEEGKYPEIESLKERIVSNLPIVLVTGHRRENFGEGFLSICHALKDIAASGLAHIIYPVHLNPNVQDPVFSLLSNNPNITLIEPLPYPAFIWLMKRSKIILTDSGGIQEEAPSLGKPVLVMREVTERPEAVQAGTVILVGTDKNKIVNQTLSLLRSDDNYSNMSKLHNPYGDGQACNRIVQFMKNLE